MVHEVHVWRWVAIPVAVAVALAVVGGLGACSVVERRPSEVSSHRPGVTSEPAPASPKATALIWADLSFQTDADTKTREATYRFRVRNVGDQAVTIVSAGRGGAGLRLLHGGATPLDVPPGGEAEVSVRYSVLRCEAVPRGSWPLPVSYRTARGGALVVTQLMELGGASPDDPWQLALAGGVCHPQKVRL